LRWTGRRMAASLAGAWNHGIMAARRTDGIEDRYLIYKVSAGYVYLRDWKSRGGRMPRNRTWLAWISRRVLPNHHSTVLNAVRRGFSTRLIIMVMSFSSPLASASLWCKSYHPVSRRALSFLVRTRGRVNRPMQRVRLLLVHDFCLRGRSTESCLKPTSDLGLGHDVSAAAAELACGPAPSRSGAYLGSPRWRDSSSSVRSRAIEEQRTS
jgi:hypothetical protein